MIPRLAVAATTWIWLSSPCVSGLRLPPQPRETSLDPARLSSALAVAPPYPTLGLVIELRRRDEAIGSETCGFLTDAQFRPFACGSSSTCTNSNSVRGCCTDCKHSTLATGCLDRTHSLCTISGAIHNLQYCCDYDPAVPYCATYLWSTSTELQSIQTLYICESTRQRGPQIMAAASESPASPQSQSLSNSSTDNSGPPVGGIVGGILGGVALGALLVAWTIYLVRRRRLAAAASSSQGGPTFPPPEMTYPATSTTTTSRRHHHPRTGTSTTSPPTPPEKDISSGASDWSQIAHSQSNLALNNNASNMYQPSPPTASDPHSNSEWPLPPLVAGELDPQQPGELSGESSQSPPSELPTTRHSGGSQLFEASAMSSTMDEKELARYWASYFRNMSSATGGGLASGGVSSADGTSNGGWGQPIQVWRPSQHHHLHMHHAGWGSTSHEKDPRIVLGEVEEVPEGPDDIGQKYRFGSTL